MNAIASHTGMSFNQHGPPGRDPELCVGDAILDSQSGQGAPGDICGGLEDALRVRGRLLVDNLEETLISELSVSATGTKRPSTL